MYVNVCVFVVIYLLNNCQAFQSSFFNLSRSILIYRCYQQQQSKSYILALQTQKLTQILFSKMFSIYNYNVDIISMQWLQ